MKRKTHLQVVNISRHFNTIRNLVLCVYTLHIIILGHGLCQVISLKTYFKSKALSLSIQMFCQMFEGDESLTALNYITFQYLVIISCKISSIDYVPVCLSSRSSGSLFNFHMLSYKRNSLINFGCKCIL